MGREVSQYPTTEEFEAILRRGNLLQVVEDFVFEGVPYVFSGREADYQLLRRHISAGLGVGVEDLTLVGSGRIGFSLSPDTFGRPFSESSDLDVVVVSAPLFDVAWLELLRARPRYQTLTPRVQQWYDDHRNHVYYGRIWPAKLAGVIKLSRRWFGVFKSLSQYPELADREVHGLLYRTWDHARLYHQYGLSRILRVIRQRGET
jgi:hypothetical protein